MNSVGEENGAGIGMFMGLVVLPLWLLFSVPVIAMALYGIHSASKMTSAAKRFRLIVSYTVLVERVTISTILVMALFGAFEN